MNYDNYIFDLYGTLVDIHTEEEKPELWEKLALFYGYYGAVYQPEDLHDWFRALIAEGEAGLSQADAHEAFPEIEIEYIFQKLYEKKGITADLELAVHTGQFFRVLSTEYIRIYEGVPELLQTLKKAGKRIYLLSNAQRIFTEYEMHLLDIKKYFDDIFISSSCGVKKPDIRFFRELLDKYQIDVNRAIMIGNDMNSDIAGANAVGLHTCYIHSNISPELVSKPLADIVMPEMDIKALIERLTG